MLFDIGKNPCHFSKLVSRPFVVPSPGTSCPAIFVHLPHIPCIPTSDVPHNGVGFGTSPGIAAEQLSLTVPLPEH